MKKILLVVSGCIAAYKSAELVRQLKKIGYDIQVAMTHSASNFVGSVTFQALSGQPVFVANHDFSHDLLGHRGMAHIDLSRQVDLILVAPATANIIAKITHGIADDTITTLLAARKCPLMIAPGMNVEMWHNAANLRNIAQCQTDGIIMLGPGDGEQACGEVGLGRMMEPHAIVDAVNDFFTPKRLANVRVLITAGASYEAIDPVRGITNRSSGAMGFAIAAACRAAGANVTVIKGLHTASPPNGVRLISAQSAEAMYQAVIHQVLDADIFISVAAVADYTVANPHFEKHKKTSGDLHIELTPSTDILKTIAHLPNPPFCVGFAAETHDLIAHADHKRKTKKLPLLVANSVKIAMGTDHNQVHLLSDAGIESLPLQSKQATAQAIVQAIATQYTSERLSGS
jgi:phosphopantothenoylcysteine decarboxylase/phosphopantothenate--cysteine ligase